jgi:hypothetical protein
LIGDVGGGVYEEIDFLPSGAAIGSNFGWPCREGPGAGPSACAVPGAVEPLHAYQRTGGSAAVTGGVVVRDAAVDTLYGRYLYADHYGGQIRSLAPPPAQFGDRAEALPTVTRIVAFGEDSLGRVYVVPLFGSAVRRIACDGSCAPAPGNPPGGGGGTPDPPAGGPPAPGPGGGSQPPGTTEPDRRPPVLVVRAARRQSALRTKLIRARVSCDEPCRLRITPSAGASASTFLLQLSSGRATIVNVPLSARLLRRLARSAKPSIALTVRARDAAGNLTMKRLVVLVRKPARR